MGISMNSPEGRAMIARHAPWPYHPDGHGGMRRCESNPCSLHSQQVDAVDDEDAARKFYGKSDPQSMGLSSVGADAKSDDSGNRESRSAESTVAAPVLRFQSLRDRLSPQARRVLGSRRIAHMGDRINELLGSRMHDQRRLMDFSEYLGDRLSGCDASEIRGASDSALMSAAARDYVLATPKDDNLHPSDIVAESATGGESVSFDHILLHYGRGSVADPESLEMTMGEHPRHFSNLDDWGDTRLPDGSGSVADAIRRAASRPWGQNALRGAEIEGYRAEKRTHDAGDFRHAHETGRTAYTVALMGILDSQDRRERAGAGRVRTTTA